MLAAHTLKTLRNRRHITVREVEQASRRIADVKGDKRFCISNGWLAQLENGVSEPSICKLFSLSVIYRASFLEMLRLYNVDVDDKEKYEPVADPFLTQLISDNGLVEISTLPDQSVTSLATTDTKTVPDGIIYGHLGLADFTMYPMIRPNALLKIDTSQNKLQTNGWRNEYERPIYFVELRQAYACGWCELQGSELLIIPHHSSPANVRRFTYPREAEIVGRVISYSTPCVDLEPHAELGKTKALQAKSV
ncbi:MAG TPA: helix-turn-helix transcriptional regulator [Pyrinomonadaceae bacterium]